MTVDRLSALDQSFLRLETESAHMHVGWTLFVAGPAPSESELRAHVAARLDRVPRFRQRVLSSPLRLHDPIWVDDEDFDLAEHVRTVRMPPGAGPAATRRLAGELLSAPLDRARPLWRLHLIDGLDDGRFVLVGQVHHALADTIAAVEMAQLLLDPSPVSSPRPSRPFVPAPSPGRLERMRVSAGERLKLTRSASSLALRALATPSVLSDAAAELRRLGGALAACGAPAPRTALNRPIGPRRSVAFARLPRHVAQELARLHGAGTGDVVLSTASLALGRYLRRQGESHPWLRVLVPVSTREPTGDPCGNQVSAVFVELPIGERDPRATLEVIVEQTRRQEHEACAGALGALLEVSSLAPAPLRDVATWVASRPQTFNAVVADIPGPAAPLYLLGRRVQAAYPTVPLVQGHGLSVGVLAYGDSLHVGLYADSDVVPELVDLGHDLTSSFDALRLALEPPSPPRVPRPRGTRPGRRAEVRALV